MWGGKYGFLQGQKGNREIKRGNVKFGKKWLKMGKKTPKITWACGKVKLGTPVSVKKALPGGSELSEMLLKLQRFMHGLVDSGAILATF